MSIKHRAASAAFTAVLSAALLFAPVHPALAKRGSADPHAELLASRFGCMACHSKTRDVFSVLEGKDSKLGAVSDDACLECHTGGGDAPQVYGGDPANYRARNGHGHNDPSKVSCLDCHAVHAAGLEKSDALTGKLLKRLDYQREAERTYDLRTAPHDEALSVWCTGCHKDSWPLGDGEKRRAKASPRAAAAYDAHPLKVADGTLAFGDSTSCRSCHAAGAPAGIGAGDFPHYTPDADMMLVGSDSATGEVTGVRDHTSDGVCLRCHRTGAGPLTVGVGITY